VKNKLRNASIVTQTKLELIHYTRDQVNQLCAEVPSFKAALDRTAQERLGA
jgi:hypothetical protein